MERKLSAIFVADMVEFSRLMEADEIGTLKRLKIYRTEIISPAINDSRGRIVKDMGDGILAEFPSVVEAVQCAVAIQKALAEREAATSEDQRIRYRIGVNLGDIVWDQGDIFGDGVNVAARLEQLAEPGGICISGTAYDQMRSILDVGYAPLGDVRVKNIQRPIRAYKVLTDPQHSGMIVNVNHRAFNEVRWRTFATVVVICLTVVFGGTWWWMFQSGLNTVDQDAPPGAHSLEGSAASVIPTSLPFETTPDPMICDVGDPFHPDWHTEGTRSKKSPIRGTLYIVCPTQRFGWNSFTIPINWFDEAGNGYTDCDYKDASRHYCWITVPQNQLRDGQRPSN